MASRRLIELPSLIVVLLQLTPRMARAQEIPCEGGPCLRSSEAGTHFLAEVNGGGSFWGGAGLSVGGLLGVGGKLRGFPLRFYLGGEFAYSSNTETGASPTLGTEFRDQRGYRDLALGLRVYLPVLGRLRLFGDILGGGSWVSGTIARGDLVERSVSGWEGLAVVGGGLQLRLVKGLSVGLRARYALTGDELDGLRSAMGVPSHRPASVMAGLTWHF